MLSPTLNGGNDTAGPSGTASSSHRDAASSSSSAHPFSLKVRSILTRPPSKYDDEVVAKGLRALQERYALGESAASSSKSRVKAKTRPQRRSLRLHSDSSDEDDHGNDAAPSTSSSSSSSSQIPLPLIKSHLERDAHSDLLHSTSTYLTHLTTITTHLNSISTSLTSMRQQCDLVDEDLSRSNDATRYLLEQASGLERQRTVTQQQGLVARLFLSRFSLTEKEREIIQRRDYPVGADLFTVMDRLHSMRQDCLALLEGGGESGGGTRAGTDVMAETGALLDLAYEKVGRFLNFHFRQAPKEGLDVGETLRECVGRLVETKGPQGEEVLRPALGVLAGMRSSFLAASFQQALQRGTGEGDGASSSNATSSLRPIEMHAHDPMRYVGDMLAWVHQAVAGEREFLGQLFGEKEGEGGRRVGERRRGIEGSIDWGRRGSRPPEPTTTRTVSAQAQASTSRRLAYVRDTLNRSLEGCCRPLTVRVQQTIDVQSSPLVALRLFHLIDFYTQVMLDTLGSRSSLSKALKDLNRTAWQAFAEAVEGQAEQLQREAVEVPAPVAGKRRGATEDGGDELGPPTSLLSALATVKELIDAHGQSASVTDTGSAGPREDDDDKQQGEKEGGADAAADGAEQGQASFNSVLTTLIDAMLGLIDRTEKLVVESNSSQTASKDNSGSSDNNATASAHGLVFRLNCLERIVGMLERGKADTSSLSSLVMPLRSSLTSTHQSLVEATYSSLVSSSGLAPALSSPPRDIDILPSLRAFSSLLSSPSGSLALATPPEWLGRVSAPRQRAEVFTQAMRRLVEGYEGAVAKLREERGDEGVRELRSGEEARMLLGV